MYPINPLLGTLSIRCRNILGIQKGLIILTTIQKNMEPETGLRVYGLSLGFRGPEKGGFPKLGGTIYKELFGV